MAMPIPIAYIIPRIAENSIFWRFFVDSLRVSPCILCAHPRLPALTKRAIIGGPKRRISTCTHIGLAPGLISDVPLGVLVPPCAQVYLAISCQCALVKAMNLKQQVCSLELAKRLKELGVEQHALMSWYEDTERDDEAALNRSSEKSCTLCGFPQQKWHKEYSAFTVAELGEMLPDEVTTPHKFDVLYSARENGDWNVFYGDPSESGDEMSGISASTEADARAKMLIYLIENDLLAIHHTGDTHT